jgi:hypothetical protein
MAPSVCLNLVPLHHRSAGLLTGSESYDSHKCGSLLRVSFQHHIFETLGDSALSLSVSMMANIDPTDLTRASWLEESHHNKTRSQAQFIATLHLVLQ